MSEVPWPAHYRRDARWLALVLAGILAVAFAPFLFGSGTLLTSAADAPSLYAAGAVPAGLPAGPMREPDPGAGAWQTEPALQIEHDAIFVDHRVPWWDPYDGYGVPFAAAQQVQPFFPLTFAASLHPSPRTYDLMIVARFFVAGFFAGLFVLFYGGRAAALTAAVATAFAGYYILYFSMPHLSVETLFPALLWACEFAARRPGRGAVAALAAVTGAIHLGGMPESSALDVAFAGLYLVARAVSLDVRHMAAVAGTFAAGNVLGAAIGGVMLVPLVEYLGNSVDSHRSAVEGGSIVGLSHDIIPLMKSIFDRLVPLGYGPPLNALYDPDGGTSWSGIRGWFGAAAAFGALLAVFDLPRAWRVNAAGFRPVAALAVVFACAFEKSMGADWINWIGALPAMRYIIFHKYGEAIIDVCVALLCGLGVAVWERRRNDIAALAAAATVLGLLTAGFLGAVAQLPPSARESMLFAATALAAACATVAFGSVAFRTRAPSRLPWLFAGAVVVESICSYYVPVFGGALAQVPSSARNPFAGAPYVSRLRELNHTYLRVAAVGGPLWPEWAGAMRLDDPAALSGFNPSRYSPFLRAFLVNTDKSEISDLSDRLTFQGRASLATPLARRWLTLSSIGYLVAQPGVKPDTHDFRSIPVNDAVGLFAYRDPLPRAAIFHHVVRRADGPSALAALVNPAFDVHRTLVVEGAPGFSAPVPPGSREGAAIVARDGSNVVIDATLAADGMLMLNDTGYPGWTATVDGAAVEIAPADYLFRAVRVPAGRHVVAFRYRSGAVALGLACTAVGVVLTILCGVLRGRRQRAIVMVTGAGPTT